MSGVLLCPRVSVECKPTVSSLGAWPPTAARAKCQPRGLSGVRQLKLAMRQCNMRPKAGGQLTPHQAPLRSAHTQWRTHYAARNSLAPHQMALRARTCFFRGQERSGTTFVKGGQQEEKRHPTGPNSVIMWPYTARHSLAPCQGKEMHNEGK